MLASDLKQRLRQGEPALGTMMTFDFWPGYLEAFKKMGLDFVLLDCEHGAATLREIEELCRTARLLGLPVILRPEACDFPLIRKYMDMGPAGLLLPWIETQEQLDIARNAAFQPPRGRRGWGGPVIQGASGVDRAAIDEYEKSLMLIAQIETAVGIERCEQIVACPWIDALMMGPYDLSVNLGNVPDVNRPEQWTATKKVIAAARNAGKPCGQVVGNVELAKKWYQEGMQFISYSEISFLAQTAMKSVVQALKGTAKEGGLHVA
jgi:2-keto-3-deoxy-L-rhamnonate aldolase RhmA